MTHQKLLLAALIALPMSIALPGPAAQAQASFDLRIGTPPPPPPPRVIAPPPPRVGFVWVPGYWRWNGHRHVWVEGRYLRERRGYRYVAPEWVPEGGVYRFHEGGWVR